MHTQYPLDLVEEDGQYGVTSPDFPELITSGDDYDDAIAMGSDALIVVCNHKIERKEEIPEPSSTDGRPTAEIPLHVAAKILVYRGMREQGVSGTDLAKRIGRDPAQISRLLDLHRQTPMAHIDRALTALGYRAVLSGERAA